MLVGRRWTTAGPVGAAGSAAGPEDGPAGAGIAAGQEQRRKEHFRQNGPMGSWGHEKEQIAAGAEHAGHRRERWLAAWQGQEQIVWREREQRSWMAQQLSLGWQRQVREQPAWGPPA